MLNEYTGVEGAPVAGEQDYQEQDANFFSFNDNEAETGVDEPVAAGQEEEEEQATDTESHSSEDGRIEKAFAKRLAQEKEKIKRELEQEFQQRFFMQQQQQPAQQPQPSLDERAQKLSEEWMIPVEAAKAILQLEERNKDLVTQYYLMQDSLERAKVEQAINKRRKANPYLPPFDEDKIMSVRLRHYNRYGVMPTWEDAYNLYIAETFASGEFGRMAEQRAIQNITGRNRVNAQVGKASQPSQKRDIWSLSDEEFAKLKELAKQGKLTKF